MYLTCLKVYLLSCQTSMFINYSVKIEALCKNSYQSLAVNYVWQGP